MTVLLHIEYFPSREAASIREGEISRRLQRS